MTHEVLREYRALKSEKKHIEELLAELRLTRGDASTSSFSAVPTGSFNESKTERVVVRYNELIDHYVLLTEEIADKLKNIESAINQVDDVTQRNILRLYYVRGLTFERVSIEINYSYSQTLRLHRKALEALAEI